MTKIHSCIKSCSSKTCYKTVPAMSEENEKKVEVVGEKEVVEKAPLWEESEEEQEVSSTSEDSGRQSRELLIDNINLVCWRRADVEAVLQGAASSPDWSVIRR